MSAAPLHRHQLAWLTPQGWELLRRRGWDGQAQDCVDLWARQRLPLVVTQQRAGLAGEGWVALGLPAPGRWGRRRLAISAQREHLMYFDEFPRGPRIAELLPEAARTEWRRLCSAIEARGATPRVHGSYGWQFLTRLAYVRRGSDLDLCIEVVDAQHADAIAGLLQAWPIERPRLDGELVFARGRAVAWREWLDWRAGRVGSVLVKDLQGSCLSVDPLSEDDSLRELAA